ncbi:MAG: UvrB/UvrC motif-containing protein [bacterium]|nr:UvrB/UvrC motif-containing protein [bacterium]
MTKGQCAKLKIPNLPGVYQFVGKGKKVLYVGRATSLRDRVRSYFANDLLHTRGKHIVDMVALAKGVRAIKTDSVLDAVILEASMIKRHQPLYNTKEKDDKSWNYVVVTKEDFPRVLTVRERPLAIGERERSGEYKALFGPFTQGGSLQEALKIIRRIFPFRDEKCIPCSIQRDSASGQRSSAGCKPCFNRQIGLCPGVCTGEISQAEYAERIREITMLFSGRKRVLIARLKRLMRECAKRFEFEKAGEYRNAIFSLEHIRDVSLITEEVREISRKSAGSRRKPFRIEAYDIAHISGKYTVGVMTVALDGRPTPSAYRKFKIRLDPERADDTLHLEEVLRRRFGHAEWQAPDLLVVDGGVAQKRRAETVLRELGKDIPVVSVVKNERHKPKAILGNKELALSYERGILIGNAEAHRFAIAYHRQLRGRLPQHAHFRGESSATNFS